MKRCPRLKFPFFIIAFLIIELLGISVTDAQNYRAGASAGATSGVLTLTVNKPSGTVSGDVMIASVAVRPYTATITAPSGWTLIRRTDQTSGNNSSLATYWKAAGGSEPSNYAWTFSSSVGSAAGITSFYNVNTTNPVNAENGQATALSFFHATPSVTTTVANTLVIATASFASCATWTPPAGMTEAVDVASDATPNAAGTSMEMSYVNQASAAATGTKTAIAANDNDNGVAQIVTLVSTSSATISYAGSPFCIAAGTGAVTLTGTGSGTYSAGSGLSINSSTGAITPGTSTAGTYTVTYTFGGSYTTTTSVIITALTTLSGTPTESCVGGSSGTITASASSGPSPYTYNLNGGTYQSSATFTGLAAGSYTLTVKNNSGCVTTATVPVVEYAASADDQNATSTDTWTAHMYDGMNFSTYYGHFTETETFNELFGGDFNCFNVVSSSVNRSVYTETFSVKFKMNSTKKGLYTVDLGSDDGSRLTIDGTMVYNNWGDQSFSTKSSVLMNLKGTSSLLYEFYENATNNRVIFQNLTLVLANTLSTNTTQSFCSSASGTAISGDSYGTLPTGISLSGTGYQWTYSTTPGGARIAITGATGATFTPSGTTAPFNTAGTYYVYRNAILSSANNVSPNPYTAANESNAATITVVGISLTQIPASGIIANYKFEGNANDAPGNNTGTLQNSPTQTADRFNRFNKAFTFNGTSQYVSTANQYINPTNFTVSIWFKTATTTGGKLIGFGASQTGQSGQFDRHIYMNNAGQIFFGVYASGVYTINSSLSFNDNTWHLATASLSSSTGMALYVDGSLVGSNAGVTTAENTTGYWKIGFDNLGGWTSQPTSFYFNGALDDALIYQRALTASEVSTVYTSPDGAGNNGPVCYGSAISFSATTIAGATYSWTGPNSFTSTAQNPSFSFTTAAAGIYTLRALLSGCSDSAYSILKVSPNAGMWTGNTSTDWTDATNWYNNTVPTASTNVVIPSTAIRMPLAATSVNCNNLTISSGATLTTTSAGTLNIAGTLANSGTMTNSGTTNFNGTSGQQSFSGVTVFNNLTLSNTSGLWLLSAITVSNNLQISAGILNANNFNIAVNGNWINNAATNALTGGTATVTFSGAAAQTIGGTSSTTFNNLTIANTASTVTLTSNMSVAGNLSVSAGIFDLATYTCNRASNGGTLSVSNNATLRIGGTNTFPSNYSTNTLVVASNVEYAGVNQTVSNQLYGNLILKSSSGAAVKTFPGTALTVVGDLTSTIGAGTSVIFTAAAAITVNGNMNIGASATFNGSSYSHSIGGNWVNAGTFNGNTGTVTFMGTGTNVGGAGTQNFNNLTVAASLVTFSNASVSLTGNLATTGAGSFVQASGGTLTMTGAGTTISGSGISLDNLTVSGSVSTAISLTLTGNLSVSGSFTATSGTITMSGTSKTMSGSGTKSFTTLSVSGSLTTDANFSVSTGLTVAGSFTASAGTGTFTGTSTLSGTANLYNVTINGTSLQLSASAVLGIANTFTITSGTLDVTTSTPNTVNFNSSGAQNINSITYNNLILSNGNSKTALAGLTINNNFTINTGTTFVPGNYTHSIYNSWTNNGTFSAGTSTVQFLGSQSSTITGATTFNNLTVNKSTAATTVTLQNSAAASALTMTQGLMLTGSNTITITSSRTGNGIILGNITRNHTFSAGVAYAFEGPDNTITFTIPVLITSVTVAVTKGTIADFPNGSSISRVYNISIPSGTYVLAKLRLHYEDNELNGNDESTMSLWNYNGSAWGYVGKSANSTTSNYVEQSGLLSTTNRWTCAYTQSVVQWNGSISTDWNTAGNWTVTQGSGSRPPASDCEKTKKSQKTAS